MKKLVCPKCDSSYIRKEVKGKKVFLICKECGFVISNHNGKSLSS